MVGKLLFIHLIGQDAQVVGGSIEMSEHRLVIACLHVLNNICEPEIVEDSDDMICSICYVVLDELGKDYFLPSVKTVCKDCLYKRQHQFSNSTKREMK